MIYKVKIENLLVSLQLNEILTGIKSENKI